MKRAFKLKQSKNDMAAYGTMVNQLLITFFFLEQSIIVKIVTAYSYSDGRHRLESKKPFAWCQP